MRYLVLLLSLVSTSCVLHAKSSQEIVRDMATQFLEDFSHSEIPTAVVMRNFLPGHPGSVSEWNDVTQHRATRRILRYRIGTPRVVVLGPPTGACDFRGIPADACAYFDVEWYDERVGPAGDPKLGWQGRAIGMDQVGAVFVNGRWWLSSSDWRPNWERCRDDAPPSR